MRWKLLRELLFPCVLLLGMGCGGGGGGGGPVLVTVLSTVQATLLGLNETTVIDPDATATVVIEIRSDGEIRFAATVEAAWVADIIGMHIHRGAPGVDGIIEVDLLSGGATFNGQTLTASGSVMATAVLANEITNGPAAFYVNIHTNAAPAGLVRAQLEPFTTKEFHARLLGTEETNVVDADAAGGATFSVGTPSTLDYVIAMVQPAVTDLLQAHIHVGGRGTDGIIVVDLALGSATLDAAAGTASGSVPIPRETLTRICQDHESFYCNVHTGAAPAGVARNQLATGPLGFWAALRGDQETNVVDADARGGVTVELTTLTTGRAVLAVPSDELNILDLIGAHVHQGETGVDGIIVIDLRDGADYGGSNSTGSAEGEITYDQALVARILADPSRFYANFHTNSAPAGLVRGQLSWEPESFFAALSGAEETNPVDPNASGSLNVVFFGIHEASFTLTMDSPPVGDVTGLHIHDGPAGQNGSILVDLTAGSNISLSGPSMTGDVFVAGRSFARFLAFPEGFYANAHTDVAPDGVARGQLVHATGLVAPANFSYDSPVVYQTGTAIPNNIPMIVPGGGGITEFSIDPALPAGLVLDPVTGIISGTPTATLPATTFTVTGSNQVGSSTAQVQITVNVGPPTNLTYAVNPATYVVGTTIQSNFPSNQGGAIDSYSISPAFSNGLQFNTVTGLVTGTPTTANGTTNHTVTGTNAAGSTQVTLTITVNSSLQPPNISYTSPVTYTTGSAIMPNTPTNTGGAVSSYQVIGNQLPAGLSLNTTTGVISGTPTTVTAQATYTVRATNAAGTSDASIQITVNLGAPTNLSYSPNTAIGYVTGGFTFPNMVASHSGGAVSSWSISPNLPAGLSINSSNGTIGGTPTQQSNTTTYTITASNNAGSTTATVTITVLP